MSFALGRPYRSTNCAKMNSTPRSFIVLRIVSSVAVSVPIGTPSSIDQEFISRWPL